MGRVRAVMRVWSRSALSLFRRVYLVGCWYLRVVPATLLFVEHLFFCFVLFCLFVSIRKWRVWAPADFVGTPRALWLTWGNNMFVSKFRNQTSKSTLTFLFNFITRFSALFCAFERWTKPHRTDLNPVIISYFPSQSKTKLLISTPPPSLPPLPPLSPPLLSFLPLCAVEQVEAAHLHAQLRAPCYCCRCLTHRWAERTASNTIPTIWTSPAPQLSSSACFSFLLFKYIRRAQEDVRSFHGWFGTFINYFLK